MPVNTNINVPFIPQEGITQQILTAIQAANEEHYRNQDLAQRQAALAQQTKYQSAEVANEQQNIDVRKRAQDLMEQGFPSELAFRKAQIDSTNAQTQLATMGIQQKQQMIDALQPGNTTSGQPPAQMSPNVPTAAVGPTAPATNASPGAPAPGPPQPNAPTTATPQSGMAASDFVNQTIPPHLAPQAQQILGPLGNLSADEQSRVAAAAAEGPGNMFKEGNVSGYYKPLGDAVKEILDKRGAPVPISTFESPEKLAAPGSQAAIQARIEDPRTKPEEIPQLQRLKAQADAAQANAIAMKQREFKAEQVAKQGDPDAAGVMLANHETTLTDLKTRGSTPDFIMKAVQSAQNYAKSQGGSYNADVADQQAKVAGSPTNQGFFGNVRSLIEPGGTLDQIMEEGSKIPQGQLPAMNKIADWEKAAKGSGPIAAYAAKVVGVADDAAKVMGGGQGSDKSREMVAELFAPSASPEQRAASVASFRQTVASQAKGRIGNNPFMNQYVEDLPGFRPGEAMAGKPLAAGGAKPAPAKATNDPFAQFGGTTR